MCGSMEVKFEIMSEQRADQQTYLKYYRRNERSSCGYRNTPHIKRWLLLSSLRQTSPKDL